MICSSARLKESDVVGSGLYELWEGLEFCLEMAFDICDIDDDAQAGLLMIILIYRPGCHRPSSRRQRKRNLKISACCGETFTGAKICFNFPNVDDEKELELFVREQKYLNHDNFQLVSMMIDVRMKGMLTMWCR